MKVCISAQENNPSSLVSENFGRCNYFAIFDTDTNTFQFIQNTSDSNPQGAGIASASLVVNEGCEALIAMKVGGKAKAVFNQAKTQLFKAEMISIEENIQLYRANKLSLLQADSKASSSNTPEAKGQSQAALKQTPDSEGLN